MVPSRRQPHGSPMPNPNRWAWAVAALLAALASHHAAKGFYYLALEEPPTAVADLRHRLSESLYIVHGLNPQSQYFALRQKVDPALAPLAAGADPSDPYGAVTQGSLPPWAYVLHLLVYPPVTLPAARLYLALLDTLALLAIVVASWRAIDAAAPIRMLAALSWLAIGATNNALTQGQNSLLINAWLACAAGLLAIRPPAGRPSGALALALASAKVTTGGPFVLLLVWWRRWWEVSGAAAITLASFLVMTWLTQLSPVFQLEQFFRASEAVLADSANILLLALLRVPGLSAAAARDGLAFALLVVGAVVLWWRRHAVSPLTAIAVTTVIARFWTYHRAYDDVMLGFLLLALIERAVRSARPARWWLLWGTCGATLWLPYSLYLGWVPQAVQTVVWMGCCAALLVDASAATPSLTPAGGSTRSASSSGRPSYGQARRSRVHGLTLTRGALTTT